MKLANRVAIITGAAQGIGAACARLFAEHGAKLVLGDLNEVAGISLMKEIAARGGTASFRRADVGSSADCEALVDHAVTDFAAAPTVYRALSSSSVPTPPGLRLQRVSRRSRHRMAARPIGPNRP